MKCEHKFLNMLHFSELVTGRQKSIDLTIEKEFVVVKFCLAQVIEFERIKITLWRKGENASKPSLSQFPIMVLKALYFRVVKTWDRLIRLLSNHFMGQHEKYA